MVIGFVDVCGIDILWGEDVDECESSVVPLVVNAVVAKFNLLVTNSPQSQQLIIFFE